MRNVHVSEITRNIKEMCIEANHFLSEDMSAAMKNAVPDRRVAPWKADFESLQENLQIAREKI